ncbi:diguanylate cyclase [uncultured Lamprocystis sp.]|uniref:GGDEF domain-containing protein n=1 Tax=uncultured Lamprocystis sp. TaxID=543132 RepID=UPI0025D66877|nr:diguanylate cyclase [uncultured Lamprocystis sp.]
MAVYHYYPGSAPRRYSTVNRRTPAAMFGRKPREPASTPSTTPVALIEGDDQLGRMAVDALASTLRSMREFALEQDEVDLDTFREHAEAWARHVTLGTPPPGAATLTGDTEGPTGWRDWRGIRQFVRDYCQGTALHASSVTSDLRDVIWVFIRNFSQAFTRDEESDVQIRQQIARLERLVVEDGAAADLKREVLDVVGRLTQAYEERWQNQRQQMAALDQTVRTLGDALESAKKEGETDPLTRVGNRKALDTYLERSVEIHRAFRQPCSVLLVDLDHFKDLNDTLGHAAGDQVLVAVAKTIVLLFLPKNDFVARFGGDEFAVVLRETAVQDAVRLADRVLANIRACVLTVDGQRVTLSCSIGAAALEIADTPRSWFERADRGLYAAKSAGRNQVVVGPPGPAPTPT